MYRLAGLCWVSLLACAPSSAPRNTEANKFALVFPADVELDDGQQTVIFFTTVFASAPVTFSTGPLPVFASFSVDRLTLKPRHLIDTGTYDIEIDATDGQQTDRKILHVRVNRPYTRPMVGQIPLLLNCTDAACGYLCCVATGPLIVDDYAKDDDPDDARLDVEVALAQADFTGAPTHVTGFLPMSGPTGIASHQLELTGLDAGVWYHARVRATDLSGESSDWVAVDYDRKFSISP